MMRKLAEFKNKTRLTNILFIAIIVTIYFVMRKRSNLILLIEKGFMAGRS